LRSESFQIAAQIEAAVASGDLEAVERLSREWQRVAQEIEKDDEAHKKERDPLFGLPFSN
jgi:hypothetical protein